MKKTLFLEKNNSKFSVNKESSIDVGLSSKTRLLPYSDINETLSLNSLYNDERDACTRYRFVFVVNPICSNVLFNTRTEVVYNEGSSDAKLILGTDTISRDDSKYFPDFKPVNTTTIDWKQCIRDTEYSHPQIGNFTYHCGWDIFNNHMLRANDFVYVAKSDNSDNKNFNTIRDYIRNHEGFIVTEEIITSKQDYYNTKVKRHLYQYDTILSMYDAFRERLGEENGWYGFTNPGNIEIPNIFDSKKGSISVNKLMNNNKACEFIDLYPDRSLFSFVPKVNKFRNRLEYNWDYCLTYPYANEYKKLNLICGLPETLSENEGGQSIRILKASLTHTNNGIEMLTFKTIFTHTLKVGDSVRLYYREKDSNDIQKWPVKLRVMSVGDSEGNDKNRLFSVRMSDVASKIYTVTEEDETVVVLRENDSRVDFFYKKEVKGCECRYYIRKFKKFEQELPSEINKMAFSETIYGDRVAQIVYSGTLDVDGILDNLNRPLHEVYLTIVKTNRGHNEWYNSRKYNDSAVEFSHCFGEVTSGIEMPTDDECFDYNVRRLHNVDLDAFVSFKNGTKQLYGDTLSKIPKKLEENIHIDSVDFLGDVIEFSPSEFTETTIAIVEHRFNTAQRETNSSYFGETFEDVFIHDDFDGGVMDANNVELFEVKEEPRNVFMDNGKSVQYAANINPEGYFYNPHNKITLKEVSENLTNVVAEKIVYKDVEGPAPGYYLSYSGLSTSTVGACVGEDGELAVFDKIKLTNVNKVKIPKNDVVIFYHIETKELVWGYVCESGDKLTIAIEEGKINGTDLVNNKYSLLYTDKGVPLYAAYVPQTHSFVWRELVKPSELANDSDLFDTPFSNGCFYKEQNIDFFLKRQDPRGEYNLVNADEKSGFDSHAMLYRKWGWDKIDLSPINYVINELNDACY